MSGWVGPYFEDVDSSGWPWDFALANTRKSAEIMPTYLMVYFVVTDGTLVTGHNPASSEDTTKELLKIL